MLFVVGEQRVRQREQVIDALVGNSVVDDPMLTAGVHESAPAKAGKVVRHLRLREAARDFYARWGWKHPSIDDPRGEISKSLGLQGTPTTFFLDSSHRIVTRIVGETDLAGFEQGLAAVLSPS